MDGYRKVVPRADSLVAEVIDARHKALFDSCIDSLRQIARIGRRADLVEYDSQRLALTPQTKHRLDKIVSILGIEPGRTDNHRPAATTHHFLLAGQLRRAIH